MKLLIHACCAQCLTYTHKYFSENTANEITVFWFNPNIHPFKEYERRKKALQEYQDQIDIEVISRDIYPLEEFLEGALKSKNRCEFCYKWRLKEAAKEASDKGMDAFTTTLTLSPYQDHELIKEIGGKLEGKYGVDFIYVNLIDGFYRSHEIANEMGLYKQSYCGCIFSERDRYKK